MELLTGPKPGSRLLGAEQCVGNRWIIAYKVGKGKAGGAVYGAKDARDPSGARTALKYPVREGEMAAYKALYDAEGVPKCLGLPRLLDVGAYIDGPYAVMDMLGRPFSDVIKHLTGPVSLRWSALRILTRLLVKRLEGIHRCGIVHCDIQPENILMGRGDGQAQATPYLIDLGCAQPFPGAGGKRADFGSVDYNSIRTAEEGPRLPHDDLESLGWVMCYALCGEMPWFSTTKYADWHVGKLRPEVRGEVCGKVAQSKTKLLDEGWKSFSSSWKHLADLPPELLAYLRACRDQAAAPVGPLPDYRHLEAVLGGEGGPELEASEESRGIRDLAEFQEAMAACQKQQPAQAKSLPAQAGGAKDAAGADNKPAADEAEDQDGDFDDGSPEGTWMYNAGKSAYYVTRQVDGEHPWLYEQPLASGVMLTGDLAEVDLVVPGEGTWTWEAALSNRGRIRLRRSGAGKMQSSYLKSGSDTWCKPRVAERPPQERQRWLHRQGLFAG